MTRPERLSSLAGSVAITGVGETDYAADHAALKRGHVRTDAYGFASIAFRRALADAGLRREDIDGLVVGQATATERTAEVLGLDLRWSAQADAVNAVIQGAMAIHAGLADCVALVYGNDQRSAGTQYGGPRAMGGDRFLAYVYYAPWGLTSQGALYAMMANRYMSEHDLMPEDLGRVAVAQRDFARMNPQAIMRDRLTLEAYMAARYICEPLRLFDYCLINDGGVALIMMSAERARGNPRAVHLAALARADLNAGATSLRPRLLDYYHSAHRKVASDIYEVAGLGPDEVDCVQVYDSFTAHVPFALEGFGYCPPGEVAGLIRSGALGPGGRLPLNTSGGMLSESYMQGWNHQVEAVRQLRGEAGDRQIARRRHVHYMSDVAGKVASIMYRGSFA
ncbi:thiolase family protein [Maritimibacter sp. DP1N21-5]|uniref:thiolase family protein n=1 Tax=Maritimibacter sp. DP1N21-5 TaxID=2836867 RepID=UPI001C456D47|nr:thiolase family protein [Maritimibacter sp. DP1N21-5]MBV7408551.1 thiolase family protein [Maritimibacter sp. DP1N21-5]